MSRTVWFLILGLGLLAGTLPSVAQQQEPLTMDEMQRMLLEQQRILEEQRQLIERQAEGLEQARSAVAELQTRVDELAQARGVPGAPSEEEVALRERLASVEEVVERPPDTPEDVLRAGEFPGSIRIPGTNMAAKFGGFVRLGVVESFDSLGSDDRFVVGSIPVSGTQTAGEGRRVTFSAQRSRLNADVRMDSTVGSFRAFLEGDFAGDGSSDNYRLRHAYGQFNRVLVGQTWSTFMDQRAEPEELDFEGLNGQIIERQAQVRWNPRFSKRNFALGLEDPAPEVTGGEGISRMPDFSARITEERGWGHFQTGILLRYIYGEPRIDPDARDSTIGWGVSLSSSVRVKKWDERDNVKFQLNYGEGIGRYINDLDSVGGQDAVFDPAGKLEALPAFGGYVAFQHWWRGEQSRWLRNLRTTLVYGLVKVDTFDFQPDDAYDRTQRATLNLVWSPIPSIDLGIEYLWGERKDKDGAQGSATQVQGQATFRF
jgi:hypothetical protein